MFKKSERVSSKEFSYYFKNGQRSHTPHFTLITYPLLGSKKVSVVVGKKVAKTAVKRNRLRRRVYSILREEFTKNEHEGVLLVLAKPSFSTLTKTESLLAIRQMIAELRKSS